MKFFREYLDKFVLVFLDGIMIYSKTKEEDDKHLKLMLEILRKNQLYGNVLKYELYTSHVQYIGHIISIVRLVIDLKKIEVVLDLPTFTNIFEICSFMGLPGYYRKFVKDFLKLAYPITQL